MKKIASFTRRIYVCTLYGSQNLERVFPFVRAGESFGERAPRLSIFGAMLLREHGNFQLQNGVLGSFILSIKSVPLQAWSGPEDSRKLRFPDFMTTAQGGGKVFSLTHRPHLPPGNSRSTHFC